MEVARMIFTPGLLALMLRAQVRPSMPVLIITSMITRSAGWSRHQETACSAVQRLAASA